MHVDPPKNLGCLFTPLVGSLFIGNDELECSDSTFDHGIVGFIGGHFLKPFTGGGKNGRKPVVMLAAPAIYLISNAYDYR